MIGSGLKKLAEENGMKVAKGVAYGSLRGYAATLSEGSGYKQIVITTKFAQVEKLDALQAQVNSRNITRELRVRNLSMAPNGIHIVFNDNPGTMAKIREFIDWFFPMLDEAEASKVDICSECGMPITSGCWKLIDGIAFHMHDACARRTLDNISHEEQERKNADEGNYLTGAVGALLGASLGAVVWAIVLNLGYVASLVGLLIGWLAEKGYTLLKGKQGKAKIAILVLAIIFAVILGTFGADVLTLVQMINDNETYLTMGDIPAAIVMLLTENEEYRTGVLANIGQGLLFAGLGVIGILMQANKDVSGTKVTDLE